MSGRYQAPPVRRVYIPKGDGAGSLRSKDKVAQRAEVAPIRQTTRRPRHNVAVGS
jgi:retron-type reverse transcriptase